ncbi:hypothetical protein EMIHUDRAFT_457100, partial [Emiliania huxleyi CCMP1516]|uniref:Uncharacterized protein n=2 Tax=Emiliania huxleyi TaxID=2903 RepID=A0A0D3JWP3_EMIH1
PTVRARPDGRAGPALPLFGPLCLRRPHAAGLPRHRPALALHARLLCLEPEPHLRVECRPRSLPLGAAAERGQRGRHGLARAPPRPAGWRAGGAPAGGSLRRELALLRRGGARRGEPRVARDLRAAHHRLRRPAARPAAGGCAAGGGGASEAAAAPPRGRDAARGRRGPLGRPSGERAL